MKKEMQQFLPYIALVFLLILADKVSKGNPVNQIMIYSAIGILAMVVGIFSSGIISVFAFIAVGLFCSTLWPCIFALSVRGLGKHTSQGSSFLIMMIMGGGIISWLQGSVSESIGIQSS